MNTPTHGGSFRVWLTAGALLLSAGYLAYSISTATSPDSRPLATVEGESSALEGAANSEVDLSSPLDVSGRQSAEHIASTASQAALGWRIEALDDLRADALPAGELSVQTRSPGGHWVEHEPVAAAAGGAIDFALSPAPPFEFRVTSSAFAPEMFLVDDRGFVGDGATEVVLRASHEAYVAVHSSVTGEELHSVWVAEAAYPALGAKPAFDSPGPEGFQIGRRGLSAPFPARILESMQRPLVGAAGCAWGAVPDRARTAGGRVLLGESHDVIVHVGAASVAPVGGIDEISLQLTDAEVGRWSSSAVSVVLTRAHARNGQLDGDFRFSGVPVPILSAAAEAKWAAPGETEDGVVESARGAGGLDRATGRVELTLHSDRPEEIVEGYVAFADADLASQVTGVALHAVGAAIHVDNLLSRRIAPGTGFTITDEGQLHWKCRDLRPGTYALGLQPLGIYCSLEVESTEIGLQTLVSEVPPLVSVGVNLLDGNGELVTGERRVGFTAFVAGPGAARPTVTRPVEVVGDEMSSPTLELRVPAGSLCFIDISSGEQAADGELLAEAGALHDFQLQPEMRWVTLRRTVPDGEARASLRWWLSNVYRLDRRGEKQPLLYRMQSLRGAPSRSDFTAWGVIRERAPSSELEVAVPVETARLLVRGSFEGAGDELIDIGSSDREVLVASF